MCVCVCVCVYVLFELTNSSSLFDKYAPISQNFKKWACLPSKFPKGQLVSLEYYRYFSVADLHRKISFAPPPLTAYPLPPGSLVFANVVYFILQIYAAMIMKCSSGTNYGFNNYCLNVF